MATGETLKKLEQLARLIRYYSLISTTQAGSGHPTSALSATDLMTGLVFGGAFRYDLDNPDHPNNDRLIFSKGHASPLFYSLWAAAGKLEERDMMTYRHFGSPLEGHPTAFFRYAEAATGSLAQGLAIGVGEALNAKLDKLSYKTYILLGDSEMAEGSQWESLEIAAHYKLNNLIGILDVNRLGQRGETMYGHDLHAYKKRCSAFGWETLLIDGHSFPEILSAYEKALNPGSNPVMIIAKTIKGKGAPPVEDKDGWHGKGLEERTIAEIFEEWGEIDKTVTGDVVMPENLEIQVRQSAAIEEPDYSGNDSVPTRNAYGNALARIYPKYPGIVSLDAEVSNSTRAKKFKEKYPDRFFEMYIAEQNMVGAALGFSCRGKIPFVSTFSAFMSRAFDQIRMSRYSDANIKFVGSHAGVSIGQDGPSQMGLEDIAMFRTILDGVVLYPSDAVSAERMVEEAARHKGIVYIRTTRGGTPIIYRTDESFPIGGSKVLRQSDEDRVAVVAAGITVHEALKAYETLHQEDISIRVIDAYSIKPMDETVLRDAMRDTKAILTVEDHYAEGGLGEAARSALAGQPASIHSLAVRKKPRSGKPDELLDFEEIASKAIVNKVRELA